MSFFKYDDQFSVTIRPSFSGPARFELSKRFDEEFHAMHFLRSGRKELYVHGQLCSGDMEAVIEKMHTLSIDFRGRAHLRYRLSTTPTQMARPRVWWNETKVFVGSKYEKDIANEFADKRLIQ